MARRKAKMRKRVWVSDLRSIIAIREIDIAKLKSVIDDRDRTIGERNRDLNHVKGELGSACFWLTQAIREMRMVSDTLRALKATASADQVWKTARSCELEAEAVEAILQCPAVTDGAAKTSRTSGDGDEEFPF